MFQVFLIVFGFGLLIGIHELGHFIAAKWAGIRTHVFAIGMGPVLFSWRKGIGFSLKSTRQKVIEKCGKDAPDLTDSELKQFGISETEYTLRVLPIGGFVTMLGQEDGNPDAVSNDPRSYNNCPIGKRMIVVSAGVVMNILLAATFFLICFQVGVQFPAPVIGHIIPDSPASQVVSVEDPEKHLASGDQIISIDGKPATTFTDIQIAGAMAAPDSYLQLKVKPFQTNDTYTFDIQPKKSKDGLLGIGVFPSSSLTLSKGQSAPAIVAILNGSSLGDSGITPGMTMQSSNGQQIETWSQFNSIVQSSNGKPIHSVWQLEEHQIQCEIPVVPSYELLRPVGVPDTAPQNYERGLLGLVPLSKVSSVLETSPNVTILQEGDLILGVGQLHFPRMGQLRNFLQTHADADLEMQVMRDGKTENLKAIVKDGKLGVMLLDAWDTPILAQPLFENLIFKNGEYISKKTPIAGLQLLPNTTLQSINGKAISTWADLRFGLLTASGDVELSYKSPSGRLVTATIQMSDETRQELSNLGWSTALIDQMFEPMYVTKGSGGNPLVALQMGFDETIDMIMMTYLTIDRLFRRTVGVEQLRGPVGIIHIGSKIADRGFSYLLFFLAIISVNLAVLNFLPLPIVDGGLFLYLIYEKFFGKPPSIAFQNAAAVLGLGLIGMLFVVTFYNDIMRLVG